MLPLTIFENKNKTTNAIADQKTMSTTRPRRDAVVEEQNLRPDREITAQLTTERGTLCALVLEKRELG